MNKEKIIRRRIQDAEKQCRMGHPERAARLYESVLKLDPSNEQANIEFFRSSSDEWLREKAVTESDRLVDLFPHNSEAWMFRGISYTRVQKNDEAAESYRRSLALDPENYRSMHNLGSIMVSSGEKEEGLSLLEHAVAIRPDYEIGHLTLAQTYYMAGRFDDVVREAELSLGIITEHPDLQIIYGDSLYRAGMYSKSREIFSRIVETTLLSSQMYAMLCPLVRESDGYLHQGSVPDADPDYLASTYYRSFLSLDNVKEKKPISEADLLKVLEINPRHSYALSGLASLYKLDKQVSDAIAWIDKAIESDPTNPAFIRQKAFIIIDDDPQASLDLFEELVARDSGDVRSGLGKAWALKAVGRDEECNGLLKSISEQDPAFIFGLMGSPLTGKTPDGSGVNGVRSMREHTDPDGKRRFIRS